MQDDRERALTRKSESDVEKPHEDFDTGKVARTLHSAMEKILEKEISPASINAACNCAQQITNILKLHLEARRLKTKMRNMGL